MCHFCRILKLYALQFTANLAVQQHTQSVVTSANVLDTGWSIYENVYGGGGYFFPGHTVDRLHKTVQYTVHHDMTLYCIHKYQPHKCKVNLKQRTYHIWRFIAKENHNRKHLSCPLLHKNNKLYHYTTGQKSTIKYYKIRQQNVTAYYGINYRGFVSHSKNYTSFLGRFLQIRWPNLQCQSTEGSELAAETGFNPTRTIPLCHSMNQDNHLWAKHSIRLPVSQKPNLLDL